jgi:hypothetical protein
MSDADAKYDRLVSEGLPEKLVEETGEIPAGLVVNSAEQLATVRPWLQDFSMRHRYGPREIRAEIEAVYDTGGSQWLLWNPHGRYTEEALKTEESPK